MPKTKATFHSKVKEWLKNKPELYQELQDQALFCTACGKTFKCTQKSHLEQHEFGEYHRKKVLQPMRQTTLTEGIREADKTFNLELCEALIAADVPWTKLENPKLNAFLAKHCHRKIPSESTLRKNYLPQCYNISIERIQKDIGENNIWVSVDESTDRMGRAMANLVVGKLSDSEIGVPYLLASKPLLKTNASTMAQFINESLGILWPSNEKYERTKLLLTDGAAYMMKCGRDLKIFFPKLIHFTCLAHCLNLVAETVRHNYEVVDTLIANVKKIFLKAPLRVQRYKEVLPDLPLPPEAVLTRWGTWLKAAFFFAENFEEIKMVVLDFEKNSVAVDKAQQCFSHPEVKNHLIYIKAHFKIVVDGITKLETVGLPLTESLAVIDSIKNSLTSAGGAVAKIALQKLESVLVKNPGYQYLSNIRNLLNGENSLIEISDDWSKFKYAPVTSCDVERSFAWLHNIFNPPSLNLLTVRVEIATFGASARALLSSKLAERLFLKAICLRYRSALTFVNFLRPCSGVRQ